MGNILKTDAQIESWVLKNPVINLYLMNHIGTVNSLTPVPAHAKKFKSKEEAIDFNHDSLSGDYEAVHLTIGDASDSFFYEKPQERKIEGKIEFIVDGESYESDLVYTIPCERCNGCPVYKINNTTNPTSYYCQAGFLFGAFNKAIKENAIPSNCRIAEVCVSKNYR